MEPGPWKAAQAATRLPTLTATPGAGMMNVAPSMVPVCVPYLAEIDNG